VLSIQTLTVGPLQSNCHLAIDTDSGEAVVIDPGADPQRILEALEGAGARCVAIWNTHAHIDHIGANADLRAETGADIWVHEDERAWLADPELNLAVWVGIPFDSHEPQHLWKDGDEVEALGRTWRIEHVPGHSPGHVAIICDAEKVAFTGDLLFLGSMGRIDLPGGDRAAMRASLRRALEWPDDLKLHVGHGSNGTLARIREGNVIVRDFLGGE